MRPSIILNRACVEIPIYNQESLSIRKKILGHNVQIKVVKALTEISLKIQPGDSVGLYGHNGAGKTTLLRCLAGGYYPTSGTMFVEGRINSLIDVGLGLDPEATGLQNIKLKLTLMRVPLDKQKSLTENIVSFSELEDFIHLPFRTYSSGMGMRLAFSIATSVDADILLLDEWLSVGDESFSIKSNQRMKEITTNSSILIIASHSMDLLKKNCNRIIHMEHGKIVSEESYL